VTTTTHFDIYNTTTSYRADLGRKNTFEDAEVFARWHAARRGIRVTITKTVRTTKRCEVEQMATVSRDALGRLWTDLTWHGASFL
jgi:hypothetical protein